MIHGKKNVACDNVCNHWFCSKPKSLSCWQRKKGREGGWEQNVPLGVVTCKLTGWKPSVLESGGCLPDRLVPWPDLNLQVGYQTIETTRTLWVKLVSVFLFVTVKTILSWWRLTLHIPSLLSLPWHLLILNIGEDGGVENSLNN